MIVALTIGSKFYACLATWYKKSDWGKTKYGSSLGLQRRYLEGTIQKIVQKKPSSKKLYLVAFPAMIDAKPVFFDSKKFIGNPMYVLSPLHLPQDAYVMHNLNSDFKELISN